MMKIWSRLMVNQSINITERIYIFNVITFFFYVVHIPINSNQVERYIYLLEMKEINEMEGKETKKRVWIWMCKEKVFCWKKRKWKPEWKIFFGKSRKWKD